ncbi:beta-lactamase-like protein [Trametes polyzona]|nr:beta-lactamase-like protein [Trametes polyzona]
MGLSLRAFSRTTPILSCPRTTLFLLRPRAPCVRLYSYKPRGNMSSSITLTFLGTTSGGGPTETRNCSSLVLDPLADGSLWMVDCAEGTVRQFAQQPYRGGEARRLRIGQVSKIFITHMHADHTMGLLTVLRNTLGIPKPPSAISPDTPPPNVHAPRVEIFGPRGVRRMLRSLWHLTHTHSEHPYAVHELLFPGEAPSVPADVQEGSDADEVDVRRESECVGRDIWCDAQGFWRGVVDISPSRHRWGMLVDAGPIEHRDPCIGYILREIPYAFTPTTPTPRKLVILGDTYDPSPLEPLIQADPPFAAELPALALDPSGNPEAGAGAVRVPVSLLVHEATDAYLGPHVDPTERTGRNRTQESVDAKTRERGHSTPAMAGAFARRIGAERLVLNHIGARFPAPDPHSSYRGGQEKFRQNCMREIERQAAHAWSPAPLRRAYPQAAWDFLVVPVPPNRPRAVPAEEEVGGPSEAMAVDASAGAGRSTGGGGGARVEEDLPTEVEMEGQQQQRESHRGRGEYGGGQAYGVSAENMGARHDRKRGREGSGGSGRGYSHDGASRGGGRGGYDGRREYSTSGGRGGGGGGGGGGVHRAGGGRGGGGGSSSSDGRGQNKRARGRGGRN